MGGWFFVLVNLAMSIIAITKKGRVLGGLFLPRWREERFGFVGGGHDGWAVGGEAA